MTGPGWMLAAEGEFQAHHSWLPETQEIIWGSLAFLIVLVILIKYAGPAVRKGMAARSDRIAKEMDDATRARADAERRAAEIRAAKGDIAAERARIEAEADATAERVLTEGRARLEAEVAELEARADAEIAGAGGRLASELQSQVATMSLTAAERVVAAQLDAATQAELVERFIARVGASGPNGDTRGAAR